MKYPITDADREDYAKRFMYHPPKDFQTDRYAGIRSETGDLAEYFLDACPPSRERSLALTKLEEAVFWANASIARRE